MAQHDYDISNSDGATVRADINAMAEAIATLNSGSTAPSTTFAYMWWADTANGILKRRNAANTAWISVMSLTTGNIIGTDVQAYNAALATIAGLSIVAGDILYGSGANAVSRLAKGTDGQFLSLVSGVPAWVTGTGVVAGTPIVFNPIVLGSTSGAVAHGLSGAPDFLQCVLECLSADNGYTAGEKLFSALNFSDGGVGSGLVNVIFDATNITARLSSSSIVIVPKSSFTNVSITPANWKMTITPFKVG